MNKLSHLIVTVFGIGYMPYAPGTFGSLVGLIGGGALLLTSSHRIFFWSIIGVVALLSIICIPKYLKNHPNKTDPSEIVIDEVLGQMIAMALCQTVTHMAVAFVLFRIFDIWKPWPVCWADRLEGSHTKNTLGIVLDDILAGLLVWPVIWVIR